MAETRSGRLPEDLCEHLLSKNISLGRASDPALHHPETQQAHEPYWCGLTQEALGPDDDIVGPAWCRAGRRTCCEPRAVPRPQA